MTQLFWICLGGAVGTGARYLVSSWALRAFGLTFPYGTLTVNVLGSLVLAALMSVGVESTSMPTTLRLALTVGVMGGFTTYSTFSYETMKYLQDGQVGIALSNVLITVVGCVVACFAGWFGGRWLVGS